MVNLREPIVEYLTEVESAYLYDIYIAVVHRGIDVPVELFTKAVWDLVDENVLTYKADAKVRLNAI